MVSPEFSLPNLMLKRNHTEKPLPRQEPISPPLYPASLNLKLVLLSAFIGTAFTFTAVTAAEMLKDPSTPSRFKEIIERMP